MSDVESISTDELSGEDEEIDEDAAFTNEDWAKYGDWFDGDDVSDNEMGESGDEALSEDDTQGYSREESSEGRSEDDSEVESETFEEEGGDVQGSGNAHDELLERIAGQSKRPTRRTVVVNEAVLEDEYSVASAAQTGEALQLQDLLKATDVDIADRKQLQKLVSGSKVVSCRLPKAVQQRQERKAAYLDSSKEASKWMPLVQTNRQAPTLRLSADDEVANVSTAAGLAAKHTPISDFEQDIADMLKAAGHQDARSAAKVDDMIGSARLSPEEWQKRQDALAKSNALLFYQERKAKRLKKIKSKAYHRHLKKKASKEIPADDEASMHARVEEEEFKRAQERLTLKHRNTSRWARRALKRGLSLANDEEREALQEQLRLGHELRVKASTLDNRSDSDASTEGSSDEEGDRDAALTTRDKVELVEAIQQSRLGGMEEELPKKGLFAMPFMRRALAKQHEEVALEAEEILQAQHLVDSIPVDTGHSIPNGGHSGRITLNGPSGKRGGGQGGPAAAVALVRETPLEGNEEEDAAAHDLRMNAAAAAQDHTDTGGRNRAPMRTVAAVKAASEAVARSSTVTVAGRATAADGAAMHDEGRWQEPSRSAPSGEAEQARGAEGAAVIEDMQDALQAAFAGDDVVAEFEKDKAEAAQESTAGIEDPAALPGWGAWARTKREPEWLVKKRAKAEREKKSRLEKRADAKIQNVIICEKWDKKAAKFTVSELPFPYTQQEVYEKRLRVPLGRDTNTEASFRDLTRPSIIKQTGQIIQPLRHTGAAIKASAAKKRSHANVVVVAGGTVKRNRKH